MKNISITERLLFGIRLLSFNLEHYEDQNMGPFTNSHIRKMMSVIFVLIYSGLLYKKTDLFLPTENHVLAQKTT